MTKFFQFEYYNLWKDDAAGITLFTFGVFVSRIKKFHIDTYEYTPCKGWYAQLNVALLGFEVELEFCTRGYDD